MESRRAKYRADGLFLQRKEGVVAPHLLHDSPDVFHPTSCRRYSAGTNFPFFTCTMTMESTSRPLWSSAVRL